VLHSSVSDDRNPPGGAVTIGRTPTSFRPSAARAGIQAGFGPRPTIRRGDVLSREWRSWTPDVGLCIGCLDGFWDMCTSKSSCRNITRRV